MKVVSKIKEIRRIIEQVKKRSQVIGFVPTMGAFHPGHLSLMRQAKKKCDYLVISIFVNPTQFGPGEDYRRYPRNLARDLKLVQPVGIDLVFAPKVLEIYPEEQLSWVEVKKMSEGLCGRFRPGHFQGVATIVTKLFNIIQPDIAFFGQKDFQQVQLIKKMVRDLNMDIKLVLLSTIREKDGLAMSSRNSYLSCEEREAAPILYKSLKLAEDLFKNGERKASRMIKKMQQLINKEPLAKIDYIEIVDPANLMPIKMIKKTVLVALAVWIGKARLIDNVILIDNCFSKGQSQMSTD